MRAAATAESRHTVALELRTEGAVVLEAGIVAGEARRDPCTPRRCRRHYEAQRCSDDGHTPVTTRPRVRIST